MTDHGATAEPALTAIPPGATAEAARPLSIVPSWVVYGFMFLAIGAWTAFAAPYFALLGLDVGVIGVLAAVPSAVAIVAGPVWGLAADRLGDMRGPFLLAAVLAAGSGVVLAGAPPVPLMAGAVLVLAVGAAGLQPLVDARTIERLMPRRERFGQARVAGSVAFMAGTIGTGIIVAATSVPVMFVVYALGMLGAGIAAVLLFGRTARRTQRVGTVGPLAALGLLRFPGLGLFFVGSCVMWISAVGSMALFSLRVVELGGDTRLVGIGWACSALFEVPVMLLFSRLARRVGVGRLIFVGSLLFIARSVAWTLAADPFVLIASTSLGGSGYALAMVGTTSYIASRAPAHLGATAQALFGSTAFATGNIVGAIMAGQVAAIGGLWAVYPVAGVVAAAGAVLIGVALRQGSRAAAGGGAWDGAGGSVPAR